jgi:hypothetical protein
MNKLARLTDKRPADAAMIDAWNKYENNVVIQDEESAFYSGAKWGLAQSHFAAEAERMREKILSLIAEFGDHPALCLGAIIEYLTRPKGEHSINADGSCNLGCC